MLKKALKTLKKQKITKPPTFVPKPLGIQNRVYITGLMKHEKAISLLSWIDLFVYPSSSEGCPNAILEAMLAKKTIVASRIGGMADVLIHNKDAYMIQPRSAKEIVDATLKLSSNREKMRLLGENARRNVLKNRTLEREFKYWVKLYNSVSKTSK